MDYNDVKSTAEAVSLALTVLTMHMCAEVVRIWWRDAWEFLKGARQPVLWIAFGACVHYVGNFVDNGYWGHAWDWKLKGMPTWLWWFENGVWSNIPARQIATTVAAYCYVRGTYLFVNKPYASLHTRMILSLAAGIVYVVATNTNLN